MEEPPPRHSHKLPPDDHLRSKVKAELRKRIRGLRATTPADACAVRSARIVTRLEALDVVARATRAALFWPIVEKHEVDLRALDAALRARGVRVAYPSIDAETRRMCFRFVAGPQELAERGFGFREPVPEAVEAARGDLDVVVVPAIALSPTGHRIGYGAGFYDRTLPTVTPPAITVGVAYHYQLLAEVPFTAADVPVDWVVTDDRVLLAQR